MPERHSVRFDTYLTDALTKQADVLTEARPKIEGALKLLDDSGNMTLSQACAFFAMTMHLRPDLIIELGRGEGNSTVAFALAGSRLRTC